MVPFRHQWLHLGSEELEVEVRQCREEGRDLSSVEADFERLRVADLTDPAQQEAAAALLDRASSLPTLPDHPYVEPSDLTEIQKQRGPSVDLGGHDPDRAELRDKLRGAWVGRACGCLLGKPVEGWRRERMWGYLRDGASWPLAQYFQRGVDAEIARRYRLDQVSHLIEDVDCFPEDDDLNYTVAALKLLRTRGLDFTALDMAELWLTDLPLLKTCTAERVAYRNLCLGIPPPRSAVVRNPFREWIGAQIRGDLFGYVSPGRPRRAAELAFRDASISHVKNGIYGEMWVAAMVAAAFRTDDSRTIVRAGLAEIPQRSRLAAWLGEILEWHATGVDYDGAVDRVHERFDEHDPHDWCHTISNAGVVAIGLLWGEMDYGRSICRAVQPCFDTDCNGATVGSVVGAARGSAGVSERWSGPIAGTLQTGVAGYSVVSIDRLTEETLALATVLES